MDPALTTKRASPAERPTFKKRRRRSPTFYVNSADKRAIGELSREAG